MMGKKKSAPLAKIIGNTEILVGHIYIWHEILSCGHVQPPKKDIYGETIATQRRCRQCYLGLPPQISEEEIKDIRERNGK